LLGQLNEAGRMNDHALRLCEHIEVAGVGPACDALSMSGERSIPMRRVQRAHAISGSCGRHEAVEIEFVQQDHARDLVQQRGHMGIRRGVSEVVQHAIERAGVLAEPFDGSDRPRGSWWLFPGRYRTGHEVDVVVRGELGKQARTVIVCAVAGRDW